MPRKKAEASAETKLTEKIEKAVGAAKADLEKAAEAVEEAAPVKKARKKASKAVEKVADKAAGLPEVKTFLQYAGKSLDVAEIAEKCKEDWKKNYGGRGKRIRSISGYLKHEDEKAYYLVNGSEDGSIDI